MGFITTPNWDTLNLKVAYLLSSSGWNKEFIDEVLWLVDKDLEWSIPLSARYRDDILVWSHFHCRGVLINHSYPRCGEEAKDTSHAFWSCGSVRTIWEDSVLWQLDRNSFVFEVKFTSPKEVVSHSGHILGDYKAA
ncbi:hypothetical protein TIFTF001_029679 [Ficus carica]|uniref:Reverse transcriptase zinc-binding domain-containing protein n=1 Tax=Ficus carica TaxID=3494 RepID=A0AA88DWB7_FICCA|nr:hypothetical protein TIFTF001_029679 [Ficus carica]